MAGRALGGRPPWVLWLAVTRRQARRQIIQRVPSSAVHHAGKNENLPQPHPILGFARYCFTSLGGLLAWTRGHFLRSEDLPSQLAQGTGFCQVELSILAGTCR